MNLYQLHSNPKALDLHDEAHEKVPVVFWDKYKNNPEELKKREDEIAKDAEYSYYYATDVLKAPFPKGEDVIANTRYYALAYPKKILQLSDKEATAWRDAKAKGQNIK
jgi:hypothetical protein